MKFSVYFARAATLCALLMLFWVVITKTDVEDIKKNTVINTEVNPTPLNKKTTNYVKVNSEQITNWHLFGIENISAKDKKENSFLSSNNLNSDRTVSLLNPESLPATKLKLELTGVFSHEDKTKGHAIIKQAANPGMPYQVGRKLSNNIKLHSIHSRFVIINNNNHYEKLALPELGALSNKQGNSKTHHKQAVEMIEQYKKNNSRS